MKLKCEITLDDYLVGLRHLIETSPAIRAQHRKLRVIVAAIPLIVFGALAVLLHEPGHWVLAVVASLLLAAVHPSLQRRVSLKQARKIYESSGAKFLGPRELAIEERGLHSISQFEEKTIFWDSISDITLKAEHCIICVGGVALIALAKERVSEGDFDTFFHALQRQWKTVQAN